MVTLAIISPANEHVAEPVSKTSRRFVFFTDLKIKSQSIGLILLKSISSQDMFSDFKNLTAFMAYMVIYDIDIIETSFPSTRRFAFPSGILKFPSGTSLSF